MIVSGNVYYLWAKTFQKHKFLILAYVESDGRARFFAINSERPEFQKTREENKKHVIPLLHDGTYDFLTHDSWINCSELIGGWTAAELEDQITQEPECQKGRLMPKMLKAVQELVTDARLLTERDKQMILKQWPDLSKV